jgi:hypothetical protein
MTAFREQCDQQISALQTKREIAESNLLIANEKKDTEKRRLTRQVQNLKRISEDQRQEMLKMVQAHDRLQRAAAEMNTLRLSTTKHLSNLDIESLSQQLSQIPADLSGNSRVESPAAHRSKRSRVSDTPLARRIQRTPLTTLRSRSNITPMSVKPGKQTGLFLGSMTQDEEAVGTRTPAKDVVSSAYGEFVADDEGFSQFDI